MFRRIAMAAIAGCFFAGPALAQLSGSERDAQTDTQGTSVQGGGNLSSQLSKSGGVISPRSDVDPNMHVPAPEPHPNSTPVIPPSATGGNSAK